MTNVDTMHGGRVARNSVILLLGHVLSLVITFVLGIVITRTLGDAEYGRYVAGFAFATVFSSFSGMGLETLLIREMARQPGEASALLGDAGSVRLALSAMVYMVMIGATYALRFTAPERVVGLLAGAVAMGTSLADFLRAVFQAFERMEYDTLTKLIERVVAAALITVVVWRWPTAAALVVGLLVANLVSLAATFLFSRRFVLPKSRPSYRRSISLLKMAIPFGITATGVGLITRLDIFLLSRLRSAAEVGWYGVAIAIVAPITLLPQAFSGSLFPYLSRLAAEDRAAAGGASRFSLKWILVIGVPAGVVLMTVADKILIPVFGSQFAGAVAPTRILGISVILVYANTVLPSILSAMDRQHVVAGTVAMQLVLMVSLGLLLIPRLGIRGAALSLVGRDVLGFVVMLYDATHHCGLLSPLRLLAGPTVAGTIMFAVVSALHSSGLFWALLAGLGIYVTALGVTRTVGPPDWLLVRQLVVSWRRTTRKELPR